MWYSLVLYFCRIALRCFGMLLTPACIRKTVSGPYPKRQLVFEPATPPNLRELCQSVHLSVHLACQTPSNSKISTESQLSNLPKNSSPTPKLLHLTWLQIFILHLLGTGCAAHAELPQGLHQLIRRDASGTFGHLESWEVENGNSAVVEIWN